MASKSTLTIQNLEALGAGRLAALLMELCEGDAALKRRLRLELAGQQGSGDLAKEIRKRLASLGKAQSYVDWSKLKPLVADLESQRRAIVNDLARTAPGEALDLLWQFLLLSERTIVRCAGNDVPVVEVFQQACADLATVAAGAAAAPVTLARQVFAALQQNSYGQFDGLIAIAAPMLGAQGLTELKRLVDELARTPVPKPADKDRRVIGFGSSGKIYEDELQERQRQSLVKHIRQDIAEAEGDVDAYIAQYTPDARRMPAVAADIATRLMAAGRGVEALAVLDAVRPDALHHGGPERVRIAVLEALGRKDEAQQARWAFFGRTFDPSCLRDYLKRLPDFEDFDAERKALQQVQDDPSLAKALVFFHRWPDLECAAKLVVARAAELDGDLYEILSPLAEDLAGKYPLAATLVLRSMIDFTLTKARAARYKHAARHLAECARLAGALTDFGPFETHAAYEARLQRDHGRKHGFWKLQD